MAAQVLHLAPGDEIVLQYLGAAVALQWPSLPDLLKGSILQQADSVGGLPAAEGLQHRLSELISRTRN
jgi:hypothetical protein